MKKKENKLQNYAVDFNSNRANFKLIFFFLKKKK